MFADDVQRSVLLGLHRLIGDTAVSRVSVARSDENGNPKDVSPKLSRQASGSVFGVSIVRTLSRTW